MRRLAVALSFALSLLACDEDHDHEDGHKHESEHPPGHDHHEEGHGHASGQIRITRWSKELELFAEHDVPVAGKKVDFLVHLTVLKGFRALTEGTVTLELSGPASVSASAKVPVRPGIYELSLTAPKPGKYRGKLKVGSFPAMTGIDLVVHAAPPKDEPSEEDPPDAIELLKEQQWGIKFGTAFPRQGEVTPMIEVGGIVDTPPGGSAEVGAPIAGRVVAPPGGFPKPGQLVKKRQLLAKLAPTPTSPENSAEVGLAVSEAQTRVAAARAALARAERLLADQAISQREVDDARREAKLADDVLRAAKKKKSVYSGAASGRGGASWRLLSPISGLIVSVNLTAGAAVSQGSVLFRIVDPEEFWIRARVPEQDAPRVRSEQDARYQIAGLKKWELIQVTGDSPKASVVSVGRAVDKRTRTVDIIYSLKEPPKSLRVAGMVRVALPAGEPAKGLLVPRSAVLHRDGRDIVYVQLDGEHFAQRVVRVGAKAADEVVLLSGVSAKDRVVTQGTQVVRLANRPKGEQPHGHVH